MSQNQILAGVAVLLGVAAFGHCALQRTRWIRAALPALRTLAIAVVALLVVGVLLTLPATPPWSRGQTLGVGFALGGALVLLASALTASARVTEAVAEERRRFLTAGAQIGAATAGAAVLLLLYPAQILDPLGGYALGAITAGILLAGGLPLSSEDEAASETAGSAELCTLAAVAVAAATYLATFHKSPEGLREWQSHPVLLAGTLAVGLNTRGILASGHATGWPRTLAAVSVPLMAVAWVLAFRLHGGQALLEAVLVGLVGYGVIAWLGGEETEGTEPSTARGLWTMRPDQGLLAALVALGVGLVAFRSLFGYGLGLAALAGVAVLAMQPERAGADRAVVRGAVTLGLLLVLYRVYHESVAHELDTDPFYQYAGLVAGALLPALVAGMVGRRAGYRTVVEGAQAPVVPILLRVGLAGLIAVLAPLTVWVLVGERPQATFLVGLAVGAAFLLARRHAEGGASNEQRAEGALARLLPVGMALSAIQFTSVVEPLALMKRTQRMGLLVVVAAVIILWIAVTAWHERRSASRAA